MDFEGGGTCSSRSALLVTNGPSDLQRAKITRFDLARYFQHIQIEGEHGFGKPEERAYRHALQALSVEVHETWMVGDNLEWEVAAQSQSPRRACGFGLDMRSARLDEGA